VRFSILHVHLLSSRICVYGRLNSSSSPVITATSLYYGKSKNSTSTELKPFNRSAIDIEFGTVDYVGKWPVVQNFMQTHQRGLLRQWVKY